LDLKELKWSGISSCGSVDCEGVRRKWLLLNGNLGGTEDFAGILGTARRRRMSCGAQTEAVPESTSGIVTLYYYLSRINSKLFGWRRIAGEDK
jgi:hypothetical protein